MNEFQRNASNQKQNKFYERLQERRELERTVAYRAVLETAAGRLVFGDLCRRLGVNQSIWEASAKIHYNAGRQDAGHMIKALAVQAAGDENWELLEREHRAREQKIEKEIRAVHTASVEDKGAQQ